METSELIEIISRGEDSKNQFKSNIFNPDSLAAEVVAFSNSGGGRLIVGIDDISNNVTGLTQEDIRRLNQLISNVSSQHVKPPVNPLTENINHPDGLVMVVYVPDGINKPYMDNKGAIWVKNVGDKRKVTSREEIQRMFQSAGLIHGDEIPVNGLTVADLDIQFFEEFFKKEYREDLDKQSIPLENILENMNLLKSSFLNVAGALLFAKMVSYHLPAFIVKAVAYPDNNVDENSYIESLDIKGKISDIYVSTMSFILRNLRYEQAGKSVNSIGNSIIPRIVFEELIVNALIHRDYFITSPIRIFIFKNRIEIVSPGHLPNNLTIDNIKSGNSNMRNPILASFATKLLPYRGLGNGIIRALNAYNNIEFKDDRENNMFKAIVLFP
jgi:ATP-dependent DNA helicase RecG